jgi:hypothetical protein
MRDPVSPSSAIRRHPGCAERRGSRAAARRAAVLMRQIRSLERDLGANLLERAAQPPSSRVSRPPFVRSAKLQPDIPAFATMTPATERTHDWTGAQTGVVIEYPRRHAYARHGLDDLTRLLGACPASVLARRPDPTPIHGEGRNAKLMWHRA